MSMTTQYDKVVLLKTAWSEFYDGDPISGNFGYIKEHGPKSGHEKYNFAPRNGIYHGYCPPPGPKPTDLNGWTVIWVAKKPGTKGVRVIGVYYDATFTGEYVEFDVGNEHISFCVSAKSALFVPPELRSEAFPSPVRSGSCCYLQIPGTTSKYRPLLTKLLRFIEATQNDADALKRESSSTGFPDTETRRKAEKAAVDFVTNHYRKNGYVVSSRESEHVGFDLEARRGKAILRIEVKGTAGAVPYAYVTANERNAALGDHDSTWLMCMVTDVHTRPQLHTYTSKDFLAAFSLDPICYRAVLK
jgi:hypothetical protein